MRNTPLVLWQLCQQQSEIPVPGLESGPGSSIRKTPQASRQLEEKKKKRAKESNINSMFARCKLRTRLSNKKALITITITTSALHFFNLFLRPTLAAVKYDVISF